MCLRLAVWCCCRPASASGATQCALGMTVELGRRADCGQGKGAQPGSRHKPCRMLLWNSLRSTWLTNLSGFVWTILCCYLWIVMAWRAQR